MSVTKFPQGIGVGGTGGADTPVNKVYFYDSSGNVLAYITSDGASFSIIDPDGEYVPLNSSTPDTVTFSGDAKSVAFNTGVDSVTMAVKNSEGTALGTININEQDSMTASAAALNITVTNTTPYGFSTSANWTTVQTTINNLKTRVDELEAILKNFGILPNT